MEVIALLNPKGGCGKTTLSTNLARAFHERGARVLLVDTDPQGSARDWHAAREDNPIPLVALDRPNNLKTLAGIGVEADYVLIDGAAKLEDMIAAAIKVSDVIIIPVQPSPYDIWAANDLVDLVKARQEVLDGKPRTAFLISRAIKRTKLGHETATALAEYGFPILASGTTQRQVYAQTAAEGLTVFDVLSSPAIAEITAIVNELNNFLRRPINA